MSKIYFIVGAMGNGTTVVTGELVDSYRKNTQLAVIKVLGIPEKIKNVGTKNPEDTLIKLENMIANNSFADAIVFTGWRIPDHINEIYAAYPSATYVFTSADSELSLNRYMKTIAGGDLLEGIRNEQQSKIDEFLLSNSIALTWTKVAEPIFDVSRNINSSESGDISIAIRGTL